MPLTPSLKVTFNRKCGSGSAEMIRRLRLTVGGGLPVVLVILWVDYWGLEESETPYVVSYNTNGRQMRLVRKAWRARRWSLRVSKGPVMPVVTRAMRTSMVKMEGERMPRS
jgi:hypothetical protein